MQQQCVCWTIVMAVLTKKIKELKQGMVHSDSIPVANDIMISIWDARGIVI